MLRRNLLIIGLIGTSVVTSCSSLYQVVGIDKKPPEITDIGSGDTIHPVRTPYEIEPVKAYDKRDGDLTDSIKIESNLDVNTLGVYEIEYSVSDSVGNTSNFIRKVSVEDNEAPVLFGYAEVEVKMYDTTWWMFEEIKVEDNYYPPSELLPRVKVVYHNINFFKEGVYLVRYAVTDISGNASDTFDRVVRVCGDCGPSFPSGELLELNIFPQVSNGIFTVSYKLSESNKASLEIYNSLGATVSEQSLDSAIGAFTVDITDEPEGIYYLRLVTEGGVITKKVVLTK